ncbi:hypothetical protein [Reyranella sp.]|uniref:hypothetical protein n=1 Tax=Reyranella sp. TaxID=1929291 RepID=UPI0025FD057F|nr:hypothetical protein [Reyranella sp.]
MAVVVAALQVGEPDQRGAGPGLVREAETRIGACPAVEQPAGIDAIDRLPEVTLGVVDLGLAGRSDGSRAASRG